MPPSSPKRREQFKAHYHRYAIRHRKEARDRRERNKDEIRCRMYGMSPGDYDALFDIQDGVCAICQQPETAQQKGRLRELCVDHNHKTGQVRGLLCHKCNLAIGHFKDDAALVAKALQYLGGVA